MAEVGIRQLKAQASRILDEVQQGGRYVITRRGRAVGVLLPVQDAPESSESAVTALEELDRLGEEIGRGWRSDRTSGEILTDLRR